MTSEKFRLVPLLAIALGTATVNAQAIDPVEALKACAKVEDAGARAECYDTLGNQVLNEESGNTTTSSDAPEAASEEVASEAAAAGVTVSSTVVAATPEAESEPEAEAEAASGAATTAAIAAAATSTEAGSAQPIPDDVGGQRFEENTDEKYLDHVVSCVKNAEDKWVFTFDSGQVWKQVSSRRVILDDDTCQFNATVTKDFFGYKLQIEGEKGKIRISRLN